MAAKTDYTEAAITEHIFGNTNFTRPANLYIALFTAAPSDAGGGTEVSGNAYARQAVPTGASSGWTRTGGQASNTSAIVFPVATPSGWGNIVAVAIFDALTNGNMLYYGNLASSKTVGAGDQFTFQPSQLSVTDDN